MSDNLFYLFNPRSIAVLDTAFNEGSKGRCIIDNAVASGYKGKIYAVDLREGEIAKGDVYKSCLCVKGKIDLAVVLSANEEVVKAVRDCVDKGLLYILLWSQDALEASILKELSDYANKYGSRVLGPGNIGIYSTESALQLCLYPGKIIGGGVSVVSQNAYMGKAVAEIFSTEGLGISSAIALGEKIDLNEVDCLKYFKNDENTQVVCLHLDDDKHDDMLFEAIEEITKEKNVVVLSSQLSSEGEKEGIKKQKSIPLKELLQHSGAMVTESLEETIDWCRMLMVTERMWSKEN